MFQILGTWRNRAGGVSSRFSCLEKAVPRPFPHLGTPFQWGAKNISPRVKTYPPKVYF